MLGRKQAALGVQHLQLPRHTLRKTQVGQAGTFGFCLKQSVLGRLLRIKRGTPGQCVAHFTEGRLNGFFLLGHGDVAAHAGRI